MNNDCINQINALNKNNFNPIYGLPNEDLCRNYYIYFDSLRQEQNALNFWEVSGSTALVPINSTYNVGFNNNLLLDVGKIEFTDQGGLDATVNHLYLYNNDLYLGNNLLGTAGISGQLADLSNTVNDLSASHYNLSGVVYNLSGELYDLSNLVYSISGDAYWETIGGYTVTKINHNVRVLGNLDVCGNIDICSNVTIGQNGSFGFLNYDGNNSIQFSDSVVNLNPSIGTFFSTPAIFGGDVNDGNIYWNETENGLVFKSGDSSGAFIGNFDYRDVNNTSVFKIDSSNDVVDNNMNLDMADSKGIVFSGSTVPGDTTNKLYRSGSNLYWNGNILDNSGAITDLSNTVNDLSNSQLWESSGGYTITKTNNNARVLGNLDICGNIDICSNVTIGENGSFGFLNYDGTNSVQYNSTYVNLNPSYATYINSILVFGGSDLSASMSYETSINGLRMKSNDDYIQFVDGSQCEINVAGRGAINCFEENNTSFFNADTLIYQRSTADASSNDYQSGGLRLYNPAGATGAKTWGMGIFGNGNLGYTDGTNTMCYMRSNANGGSTNTQLNFTGLHRCIVDSSKEEIKIGLLVETTGDIYNIFYNKDDLITKIAPNDEEALPVVKLTSTRGSKKIFGVISSKEELFNKKYDETGNLVSAQREYNTGGYLTHVFDVDVEDDYEINYRYNIASVGEGFVRLILRNESLIPEDGDLIMTSDLIPGYAELQTTNNDTEKDDIVRSKTIGKLTCNWNNENYDLIEENGQKVKVLGCVLYCG